MDGLFPSSIDLIEPIHTIVENEFHSNPMHEPIDVEKASMSETIPNRDYYQQILPRIGMDGLLLLSSSSSS